MSAAGPRLSPRATSLVNLTYVSACMIPLDARAREIDAMRAQARVGNEINRITGALLFTGAHFVQTLEGAAPAVDTLMARIARDSRHHVLAVLDRQVVGAPNFAHWSMASSGASLFVARAVSRALPGRLRGSPRDIHRLLRLMQELGAMLPLPSPQPPPLELALASTRLSRRRPVTDRTR